MCIGKPWPSFSTTRATPSVWSIRRGSRAMPKARCSATRPTNRTAPRSPPSAPNTLQAWTPPTAAQRKLRALVRHRDDLIATRIQQTNRLQDTSDQDVRASLEAVLITIKAQLKSIQQQITAHLKANAELGDMHGLMDSVPGIGAVTAQKLLAEFYDLAAYPSAKAAGADAGLTPANYESGTSVRKRPRLSKVGKA